MVGVVSTREAIEMAEEASLDLIEISPNAVPPVAKISDYGKYKYEVTLRFRGREMVHADLGMQVLNRVRGEMDEHTKIESMPRMEGRQMIMVLAPK